VPKNNDLVESVRSVLGEKFPIAGGASHGIYFKGKVLEGNVGVLLTGNFTTGFSTKKESGTEGLIKSAHDAFAEAIGRNKKKLVVMFAFNCGGRRGSLGDNLPKELEAMKKAAGTVPIFGFYGSGEIGPKDNNSPSCGVGYSIAACAISNP